MIAVAGLPLVVSYTLTTRPAATAGRCSASNIRAIAQLSRPEDLPTLSDAIPDCPRTIWDADELDVAYWQQKYKEEDLPACPIEVIATPEANAAGVSYFAQRKEEIKDMLQ